MKDYYRVMLGRRSVHAEECFAGNYIGADFGIEEDLAANLPDSWREFNARFIPVYQANRPGKSKIAAGLSCGFLWTVAKGIRTGDVVLCPDGSGVYRVGEVTGGYFHVPGGNLPHRRPVRWLPGIIERSDMSESLQNSTGSVGTVCNISRSGHAEEVARLVAGLQEHIRVVDEPLVQDAAEFVMEKHLEDFLVRNWRQTDLGQEYDIFEEDGELVGQQYQTDTGPLDILAISKDRRQLLVVELKKGRASDVVVGQILRYMGYVQEELAEEGQTVLGTIIALEDDQRIRRALRMTPNVDFYRYEISFRLVRG